MSELRNLPPSTPIVEVNVDVLIASAKLWKDIFLISIDRTPVRVAGNSYDDGRRLAHCIDTAHAAVDKVFNANLAPDAVTSHADASATPFTETEIYAAVKEAEELLRESKVCIQPGSNVHERLRNALYVGVGNKPGGAS